MKKTFRALLSLLLVLSMLPIASATGLLIMPAPKSAGQTAAENLHALGLLAGVGNTADGSVNFDVNGSLTRAQSVVQIVRFLGAEKTAKTQTNANPFTDLAAWAVPYVSYAYANSITSGRSATTFDPDTAMNDAGFLTLLLRVLGYADKNDGSGDFVWNNPYTLAKQVGLIDSTAPDTSFTRGDAFVICYRALTATVKSGDKLCDRLVKSGAVDAKTMASVLHLQLFDGLTVGSVPITEARVIVSKDASATEKQMAENLIEDIRKAYGKTLLLTTDATNKVGAEIVIGKTAREISKKVPDLTKLETAMLVSDDSIALMAATNAKMHSLTDWFSENYITGRPTVDLTEADTTIGELLCNPIRSPQNSRDPCIEYDPETGYKLPEKVVVYGSFQPFVGATENDSNSEVTRMYYIGDNTYTLTVVIPFAGEYNYAVSTYGTLSAVYTANHHRAESGDGPKAHFVTRRDNCVVRFTFRYMDNKVSAEVVE